MAIKKFPGWRFKGSEKRLCKTPEVARALEAEGWTETPGANFSATPTEADKSALEAETKRIAAEIEEQLKALEAQAQAQTVDTAGTGDDSVKPTDVPPVTSEVAGVAEGEDGALDVASTEPATEDVEASAEDDASEGDTDEGKVVEEQKERDDVKKDETAGKSKKRKK